MEGGLPPRDDAGLLDGLRDRGSDAEPCETSALEPVRLRRLPRRRGAGPGAAGTLPRPALLDEPAD